MESVTSKKSNMQWQKDLKYPIAMIIFVLIILALFFAIARFLSMSINSATASPDDTALQAKLTHINTEDYDQVRARLHLPAIQSFSAETTATTSITETHAIGTTTAGIPVIITATTSRSSFSVAVYGSAKRSGITDALKNDLIAAGFTNTKTSSKTQQAEQTLVQIKSNVRTNSAILKELLSIVKKRSTTGDPRTLEDTSPYDIVITLGAQ